MFQWTKLYITSNFVIESMLCGIRAIFTTSILQKHFIQLYGSLMIEHYDIAETTIKTVDAVYILAILRLVNL